MDTTTAPVAIAGGARVYIANFLRLPMAGLVMVLLIIRWMRYTQEYRAAAPAVFEV